MRPRRVSSPPMTRRQVASLLGASPLLAQVTQKIPPQAAPTPAPSNATQEQKLEKALADVHEASASLARIELPMNIEPAFVFRP